MQEAGWLAQSPESAARARAYNPRYDRHTFMCPRCWVNRGVRNPMRSVAGTNEYDVLVCNGCGADVVIPFD